ncbi:hypothetical protein GOP47_0001405 [Adiantum capillus-veneris]|uniref:SHSP domain-containing protein n=1 Tax=Adiantum capillus-veneris TaxID=13818 RepID=A0A9D4V8T5_ADICA|nr:hypothetical protein GOP47_0001405 [Adiantum capillus-veneris]
MRSFATSEYGGVDNMRSFATSEYGGVDVDWLEDDNSHIFKFNVPGMKIEDVKVQIVEGQTLQVSGVRKDVMTARGYGTWHIKERPVGTFFRKFQLPGNVKIEGVTAFDEKGILVIIVPKIKRFVRNVPISLL